MKVDCLDKQLLSIGFSRQDSLSGVAAQMKEVFARTCVNGDEEDRISYWHHIFLQSKANGCSYRGEDLPQTNWEWHKNTWFQDRLTHQLNDIEFAIHQARHYRRPPSKRQR